MSDDQEDKITILHNQEGDVNPGIPDYVLDAFSAIRNPEYTNFGLMKVKVNGEQSYAIATYRQNGPEDFDVMPLFVFTTPGMKLEDEDGNAPTRKIEGQSVN